MTVTIGRRELLAALGGAAAAWPLAARAQQAGKLPVIGFIGADTTSWGPWSGAFVARLRELGWIEGRTVAMEYRWTEGRPERPAEFAAEFVRLNADIIVTNNSSAPAVKRATSIIPIVFVLGGRSSWQRPRCQSGATGWQRHGSVDPANRYCRKATPTLE